MVVSKKGEVSVNIFIDGQRVEQVQMFKYLDAMMSEDGRSARDVKARIGMAKTVFRVKREENC